jgi:hypothetical protein
VNNHYPGGVGSVFCSSKPVKKVEAIPVSGEEEIADGPPVAEVSDNPDPKETKEGGDDIVEEPVTVKETSAEPMDVDKPVEETATEVSEVTTEGVKVDGKGHDEETEAPATNEDGDAPAQQDETDGTSPEEPLPEQAVPIEPPQEEPAAPPIFTVQIVGNKYNVQNFW